MNLFVGDVITFSVEFRDSSNTLFDPSTVTFKVRLPNGTVSTLSSLTNGSTGVYSKSYTTTAVGKHRFYAIGTGANARTASQDFEVLYSVPS